VPTPLPTSAPTTVLRGYKDCVCVSALTVRSCADRLHRKGILAVFSLLFLLFAFFWYHRFRLFCFPRPDAPPLQVKKLRVHCPEVATYFSADSCLHNMTSAMLQTIASDCDALQTDFFTAN